MTVHLQLATNFDYACGFDGDEILLRDRCGFREGLQERMLVEPLVGEGS